jgi:hypothetical protein
MAHQILGPFLLAGLIPGIILGVEQGQFGPPKGSEGTRIFKADEHPRYTGQFRINGYRALLVGSMNDASPWDHLDYAGKHLSSVQGTIEIDVNDLNNKVLVEFRKATIASGFSLIVFLPRPRSREGIATRIYEHGDSGNGDLLYPKTWLYLPDGERRRCGRMIKSCTRIMTHISW